MARCGDGFAAGPDLVAAAEEATRAALLSMGGAAPDLACVFVTADEPASVAAALSRAAELSGAPTTVGCSSWGVIGQGRAAEQEPGVSVWAASLPGARLRSFHLEVLRTDASLAVLGMPTVDDDDRAGILLADPWTFPVDGFVEQSNVSMPGLPIVGGLASGSDGAGTTRLLVDGRVVERGAVGVLIGGDVDVRTIVSQGCRPIGPPMTVTRAEDNLLLELAGSPALEQLQSVVAGLEPADQVLATTGLQVGVAMDEYVEEHHQGDFLVRGVVGADTARGALAIGDVISVGRTVQFQVRDASAADADLLDVLSRFRTTDAAPDGVLLFSCNGRGRALFDEAAHDVLAVRQGLGADRVAGFFAAGEIGPVAGRNHLHGFSASLLVIGADD